MAALGGDGTTTATAALADSGNRIYGIEDSNARRCLLSWGPGQAAIFTVTRVKPAVVFATEPPRLQYLR